MDKNKNYREFIINFNDDHASFTKCGVSIRDYGDTMVLVDRNARNGVLIFKPAKNKELAEKVRNEDCVLTVNDLVINPGAIIKTPTGDRRYITDKTVVIPAKYDYNYRIKYDDGYMGPEGTVSDDHALDSTKEYSYENTWEEYHEEYGKYDDMNTAMVYYQGKQYLITGESGKMWQDGLPRCYVNNTKLLYGPHGWEAYGTADRPEFPEPIWKMLTLYLIYLRK